MERPDFFELKNGEKVKLPFTDKEYNDRVSKLRSVMDQTLKIKSQQFQLTLMQVNHGVDLIVITLFILIGKEIIF